MKSIVVLDEMDGRKQKEIDEIVNPFIENGFEVRFVSKSECENEGIINVLKDCEIAYGVGNPPFSREVFEACPKLKMIQRAGIGVNTIDIDAATEHGVLVCNAVGYCIEELAVHATAMILSNIRTLPFYDRSVRAGKWAKGEGKLPRRVSCLTLGLFGLGGSGKIMAKIWHDGFGAKVIAYDPYISQSAADDSHATLVDFETLCKESDVISVHAPLTKETYHAFDKKAFDMMKPDAIIANVTRGGLIDFKALTEALEKKKIGAAGIDTFEIEPLPADDPLLKLEDCTILSPHSAYAGKEADESWQKIASTLPVEAAFNKKLYRPYIFNRDVIPCWEKEGYTVVDERLV